MVLSLNSDAQPCTYWARSALIYTRAISGVRTEFMPLGFKHKKKKSFES